ncbi:MYXO-CTERM sorting domain-containing protein [Paraburkholderia sp. SIMBA_030]
MLLSMAAFGSTGAWASDIQCATTRQPAERVICDHAILNNEYDGIFAQQQVQLSSGKLSPEQLARWRQSRNACTDVHCIDGVFVRWAVIARSVETTSRAAVAPVMASATAMAPVGPASEAIALSASQALPTSEASFVRQGSAAGVALPQPVETQTSSPAAASAPSGASESDSATGMSAGLTMALLVAVGFGVLFQRRRSNGGNTGDPPSNVRGKDKP